MLKITTLTTCAFVMTSCGKIDWKDTPADGAYPAKFVVIRDKILLPKCQGCHVNLDNYSDVMSFVEKNSPLKSPLYTEIANWRMPQNAPHLADFEIKSIYNWIAAGAPNE